MSDKRQHRAFCAHCDAEAPTHTKYCLYYNRRTNMLDEIRHAAIAFVAAPSSGAADILEALLREYEASCGRDFPAINPVPPHVAGEEEAMTQEWDDIETAPKDGTVICQIREKPAR